MEECEVDPIWKALGSFGLFQRKQLLVLLMSIWSCGFHVLSIVFIGYRPDYVCKENPADNFTDTNETVFKTYGKCSIVTHDNTSGTVTTTETLSCPYGHDYEFPKDRYFVTEWDLVCEKAELAEVSQTLVMLGQAVGAFIFTSLADRFGRKPVHVLCHIALFAVAMSTAFVPTYTGFAVVRVLTGTFQQGVGLTCAILNLEFFPKEIRGYMEVMGLIFWTTGIALLTPVAYLLRNVSWRWLQLCLALLSSWSLIQWWIVDESLNWLIANGKIAEAKAMIQRACKTNNKNYEEVATISGFKKLELDFQARKDKNKKKKVINEIETVEEELLEKMSNKMNGDGVIEDNDQNGGLSSSVDKVKQMNVKKYTVLDLLRSRRLFLTSLIMWFAWITNSLTYYGIMLISSSLAGNRFLNFFLGSVVEYPAAFGEYLMINRLGRKVASIVFHVICGVSLIIATVLTTTANGSGGMLIGATVFTLVGKMAITGSFSTIFLYTPELYPTNMRNVGIGLSSAAARIGAMLAPFARNLAEVVVWAPGLVFGIMCWIVSVLLLWVPETNQYQLPHTIEECEQWYKENQFRLCTRGKKQKKEGFNQVPVKDN